MILNLGKGHVQMWFGDFVKSGTLACAAAEGTAWGLPLAEGCVSPFTTVPTFPYCPFSFVSPITCLALVGI